MKPRSAFELAGHFPTWCPGCGDFAIWASLKKALEVLGIQPHRCVIVYGIGCAGNMSDKVRVYGFHGLHGRPLPVAAAVKLVHHDLTVIALGGDGDGYGEGMGHFMHTMRGNHDITYLVHNNAVYGLTKGQASPTSQHGFVSNSTPEGVIEEPVNPMLVALAGGATFVGRAFSADVTALSAMIAQAIRHRGFSLIDILQPCVTFNHATNYQYYKDRVYTLSNRPGYSPTDRLWAMSKAIEWGDAIPTGVLYANEDRPAYHENVSALAKGPLVDQQPTRGDVRELCEEYF